MLLQAAGAVNGTQGQNPHALRDVQLRIINRGCVEAASAVFGDGMCQAGLVVHNPLRKLDCARKKDSGRRSFLRISMQGLRPNHLQGALDLCNPNNMGDAQVAPCTGACDLPPNNLGKLKIFAGGAPSQVMTPGVKPV